MKRFNAIILAALTPILVAAVPRPTGSGIEAKDRRQLIDRMDGQSAHFGDLSKKIWEFAEVGYKEKQSAALLKSELQSAGFQIQENVAGIETAFTAVWGHGKPVIGIMGEFDALPGLSQDTIPERKPRIAGAPGHACGHNLFGVASAFAAIAAKGFAEERKISGTIRFYGTPAEEGGDGKVYMARAGVFSDCDIVLHWHPGDKNQADLRTCNAVISAKFRFYGQASHAASAPEKGRSAVDAAMLMGHAVDMLREHVESSTRMHYIITNGGAAPNIVPDFAEIFLYARHPSMASLDGIWKRIVKCAEAGALATETRMEMELIGSSYNVLPNDALTTLIDRNLRIVGGIKYTPEEQAFAETLRKTFSTDNAPDLGSQEQIFAPREGLESGSTDAGDISWLAPTGWLNTATYVPGTPGHSWQAAACTGGSIGRKGMMVAAKTLALTAVDLLTDPAEVQAARASFDKRRAGHEYRSRIPPEHKPPLNYRDK